MQVESAGGAAVLKLVDAPPINDPTSTCHTVTPLNFADTGHKVLQLNVDMKALTNAAAYRIGLYSTAGATNVIQGEAFHFQIFPGQTTNNVRLLTFAATGVAQDNLYATTDPVNLQGVRSLALQVDYTASSSRPMVRAFANGKLLMQIQAASSGGFRTTGGSGKTVRIFVQGNSFTAGASCEVDNVSLTSFSPGAILLGGLSGTSVNRRIWGHNLEAADGSYIFQNTAAPNPSDSLATGSGLWDSATNTPNQALATRLSEGLGTKTLRYPGGCLAHGYNWKSSIGPISQRGRSDWTFGLDEYLKFCDGIGAEPVITCSDYVLPAADMPGHLAELVEYLNAPAIPAHPWAMKRAANGRTFPYDVKYFELGNESSHGNHHLTPSRKFTAEEYAQYATDCAWAMKSVDPSIQVGIVAEPGGGQDAACPWNVTVLQQAGRAVDFFVLHLYAPRFADGDPVPNEHNLLMACMAAGEQIEHHLQKYHDVVTLATGRDMALAVTEYNTICTSKAPGVPPYRFSYASALHSADLMRIFMKPENRVAMANYWQALNGFFGAVSVSSRPAVEPITERPAYPLFRLWANHFGSEFLNVEVTTPKAEFGGERRVNQAKGTEYQEEQYLGTKNLTGYLPGFGGIPNLTASQLLNTLTVKFNNYADARWPALGQATPPSNAAGRRVNYKLLFEGRYTHAGGLQVPLNALLQDSRGWTATRSSVPVGPMVHSGWKSFENTLHTLPDTVGATALLELSIPAPISGTLEIKDPKIAISTQEVFPAYGLLTAAASQSVDGQKIYLIVFNKSELHIPAPITVNSFALSSGWVWEVNGPSLVATSDVREVKTNEYLPIGSSPISYIFPAHSMTAFEFNRN